MKQPFCAPSEALRRVLDAAAALPRPETETVPLDEADGRIAAGTLSARMDQPPFDRSPFDGYALHSADTAGASRETPVTLPVTMKLYAGDAPASPLPAGCAARIMTGAPLPEGADCVLMQELTDSGEETVQLYAAMKPQQNVVFRGGDIAAGAVIADCDGLLKINREALLAVNRTPQMMIATIHGDLPVKKGQKLAGTRIIPLVIEQEKMDAMQAAAGSEPILNVLPMQAKKFAVITTGSEVFKGRIEDKFTPILVGKLAEYGCEMTFHKVCDDDPAGITTAILEAKEAGCELIFTTGGMSVDPDDRTPLAIRNTGADIVTYGAPVLPGAMFLVSYLDGVPVCGLPGCVMYAKRTIFDLLLPRLLADDAITAEDIARLGEGGLCLGCAECHWPNCGFGHC